MNKRESIRNEPSRLALCMLALLLPQAAMAADATDHLNVQEPPRPDYLPAKPGAGFQLPPVPALGAPAAAADGEAILIRHIAFRGNAAIPSSQLEAIAAPYTGRSVTAAELEDLRQKLTRHYIDRSYINSGALLGKDAIAGDTVTFDIVEGRLSAIRVRGLERLNENYVAGRLAKEGDGALNVDTLRERFQLLLDDPLFDRLNARLMPDARLGEAILDVDVVRARPYQLSAFANNYRPPSIGANAYGLNGWVRNLTGYGDVMDASVQDSTEGDGSVRYRFGWRVPLNQRGTQLSLQFDHGQSSVIEESMQDLNIKSILDSKDIGLSQVLIETLQHKLSLGLNWVERENRTTLLGEPFSFIPGEPNGKTRVRAWRFWQEYAYRAERQVLALRSTFTSARSNLEDVTGLPATSGLLPEHDYNIWLGQAQYARQVLDNGAQVIVRGNIQQTDSVVLSLDRMSIGGVFTVRGYRENQLVRDKGGIVNLEFDYPVLRQGTKGANLSLVPFYDWGRGKNQNEAADTLSSAGLAARLRWQGLSIDLAVAKRLVHPDSVNSDGGTLQDKGIHLQLSYSFF